MNITHEKSFYDLQSLLAVVPNPELSHRLYVEDTGVVKLEQSPFAPDDFTGNIQFRIETLSPSLLNIEATYLLDNDWLVQLHAALQTNFQAGFRGILLEY